MFRLIVLSALVAVAMSSSCCSMEDRRAVLTMWESVWAASFTGRRVTIAKNAFRILFEKDATTKALFTNAGIENMEGPQFKAHCMRVVNGLDTIINLAFESDSLEEQLVHLGDQHAKYKGLTANHFQLFRESFAEILPQAVPCFDVGVWNRCLTYMQDKIASHLS